MAPHCANSRPPSLVVLPEHPQLEQPMVLGAEAVSAMALWQARMGEIFTVQGPDGQLYRARLEEENRVVPFERLPKQLTVTSGLTVFQAVPARERFELVLQKLTELGADRIVPMVTARSINSAQRDQAQAKSHRWPDVLRKAARQCRRPAIPRLEPEWHFSQLKREVAGTALRVLLWEKEKGPRLRDCLRETEGQPVELFVGPEGGFSPEEVTHAISCGVRPVSLGGTILRTETAAIAATAVIQYERGRLG